MTMPSARVQRSPWPAAQGLLTGLAESLRTPRGVADELDEARAMAMRWRERVRAAEQERYGRGLLGVASQFALERRAPTTVAHRGRQAARVALYTAATAAVTLLRVLAAAVAVVAEAVLGAL